MSGSENRLTGGHTFPTDGNPMRATLASPDFWTSKPVPPPLDFPTGSRSWALYRASLAFNRPRWYSVAWRVRIVAGSHETTGAELTLFFCAGSYQTDLSVTVRHGNERDRLRAISSSISLILRPNVSYILESFGLMCTFSTIPMAAVVDVVEA